MCLVAVLAFQPGLCQMKIVLSDPGFIAMAVFQAVLVRRLYLAVRMVAVKAIQRRHHALCRQVLVAMYTPFFAHHHWGPFAVAVAFQTRQPFHPHSVDQFIRMAFRASLLVREKIMKASGMAFAAAYLLHEDMLGMAVGFVEGERALCSL